MLDYRLSLKSLLSIITITISLFFYGCASHRFTSVRFNASELNAHLDSGAKYFILQFKAPNGENVKKPYELISYAYENATTSPKFNTLSSSGNSLKFSGELLLGNNRVSREKIERLIIDTVSGKRINYKYILFSPKKNERNYIYYTLNVVLEGEQQQSKKDEETVPCPPAACDERETK